MRARAAAPTARTCHAQVRPTERRMSHSRHPLQSRSLRYEGKVSLEDSLKRSAALGDRILARFVEVHDAVAYRRGATAPVPLQPDLPATRQLRMGGAGGPVHEGHHPGAVRATGTVTATPGVTGAPPASREPDAGGMAGKNRVADPLRMK